MSSIPGYTLEDYIAWNYNLVVVEQEDPNFSLHLAEMLGNIKPRLRLSQEHFKVVLAHFEPYREVIEEGLTNFDEENQSWRAYCNYPLDRAITGQEQAVIHKAVLDYLSTFPKQK